MDAFGRVMEILVTVVLLFLIPFQYIQTRNEMVLEQYISEESHFFMDSVRNLGYLSREMYEKYQRRLGVTGKSFQISLVHYKKNTEPSPEEAGEEEAFSEFMEKYEKEILEELYEGSGRYEMEEGDYLTLKLRKNGGGRGQRMLSFLLGEDVSFIGEEYGGMIRSENG